MLIDESILLIYIKFYKENKMKFFLVGLVLIVMSLEGNNTSIVKNDKYKFLFKEITNGVIEKSWIEKIRLLQGKFDISIEKKNILYNEESEGVIFSINESDKKVLVLTSFRDDIQDRFKFYFTYSKRDKEFHLFKVYYLHFNESCTHDLDAVYEVKSKLFQDIVFNNFNTFQIYDFLYQKPVWINKKIQLNKVQSNELEELSNAIFKLYKNNKTKFKEYVGDLVEKECQLKYYFKEKYYFKKNIELSNNIAFFLEQAGYYKEAIYLLEKIIEKFPKRTVAYYNLADAYWALGEKKRAIEAYMTYIEQMCNAGKSKRIPQVVLDRVSTKL